MNELMFGNAQPSRNALERQFSQLQQWLSEYGHVAAAVLGLCDSQWDWFAFPEVRGQWEELTLDEAGWCLYDIDESRYCCHGTGSWGTSDES